MMGSDHHVAGGRLAKTTVAESSVLSRLQQSQGSIMLTLTLHKSGGRAAARLSVLRVSDGSIPEMGHSPDQEVKKAHLPL